MEIQNEHSAMVTSLAKDGSMILATMTALGMHKLHMAVGMAGEAGELMDAIFSKDIDVNNVLEELGDYEFYLEGLRQAFGAARDLDSYDHLADENLQENVRNLRFVEMMTRILAVESCNVLDLIKKVTVYNKENIVYDTMVDHINQIDFALYVIRQHFGFNLEQVLNQNIVKLSKGDGKTKPRYGAEYSDEAANNRADKD